MDALATRRWISPPRSEPSYAHALDTAVRFLAQRPRSEYEVRQRLRRAGTDAGVVETVLAQLRRHRLVDDQAFAEYWVEQRRTFRPRGARLLRAELAQRGIPRASADAATEPLEASAVEDAYRAASKRAVRLGDLDERAFATRLGQWLARRGFDWQTVQTVVARVWAERTGC
jgi:regulatory protein